MSCWYIIVKLCVLIYGLISYYMFHPCKGIALVGLGTYTPLVWLVLFEVSQMGAARTGQRRTPGERPLLQLLPPLHICCSTRTVGTNILARFFTGAAKEVVIFRSYFLHVSVPRRAAVLE
jgi:hypothetical protein